MSMWWDKCNKWLYVGTKQGQANQFVIMLDEWLLWITKTPTIREWTLFQIMWDNGAFWADLLREETVTIHHMNGKYIENDEYKTGLLNCFVQVTILGIGIRYHYNRKAAIFLEGKTNV